MKNLFLNLYADIHNVSISKAKGEIKHRVALRMPSARWIANNLGDVEVYENVVMNF